MTNRTASLSILLVEDDAEIARLLGMLFTSEGFTFHLVDHDDEAVEAIRQHLPNIVILDVMLPGMSGVDICRSIRTFYQGAVMMLTASEDDITEIASLNVGADDYLTKPVRPHVLMAHIHSLLRRVQPSTPAITVYCNGALRVDLASRQAEVNRQAIPLTSSEFDLLALLIKHEGQIVSRDHCYQQLRGIEYDGIDRSMDMRISGLRKKLEQLEQDSPIIQTIRGKGYMLVKIR
ncbi:MAG: DNA-binding response regulator [Proteobacteria bacterium]|nr:MAG: DNA-binding response regulator [Pseudomonadota bacterium]